MLKLPFLARSRLWADVVQAGGSRLFVPTTEALAIGARVTLELCAPDLPSPVVVEAVVQHHQPLDGRTAAGVYVKLEPSAVEHCARALGVERDESARIAGRSEPRVDCELKARVLRPHAMEAAARSLSVHGLTLKTPVALAQGAQVALSLTLPDGLEVLLNTEVMWSRAELLLAGLKVLGAPPEISESMKRAVEGLQRAQGPASPAATTSNFASAKCVLVADDDPSILEFASRVVTKEGLRVVRAERGDVALELARKEKPALCLLDVLMPGLDGLEVCKAIRGDATLAGTPLVLLSAMGEAQLAEAAARVGANAWLTKPMRLDALRSLIANLLVGSK